MPQYLIQYQRTAYADSGCGVLNVDTRTMDCYNGDQQQSLQILHLFVTPEYFWYWQKNIYQQAFIKHSNSFHVDSSVKRKTSTPPLWRRVLMEGKERMIIKKISQKFSKERVSKTWELCGFLSEFLILSCGIVPAQLGDTKIQPSGIIELSRTWVQIKCWLWSGEEDDRDREEDKNY